MSVETVLQRATPSRRAALPGQLLGILSDGAAVGLLALSLWLITRSGAQPPILHLTFAIVGVRALAIGRAAFRYVERLSSHDAALHQLAQLRASTFTALVPRVPGAIESSRRGEVLATFVDDVDQLQDHPLRVRQPLIVSITVTVLTIAIIAIASPVAAAILTAVLLVALIVGATLSKRIAGRSDRELADARSALTDALLDRFGSASVLAAFGALDTQRARIEAAEARLARVQLTRTRAAGLTGALVALGAGVASVSILLAIAPGAGTSFSVPVFAAIVVVPAAVFDVFAQVFAALTARRTVETSARRVAKLTEGELPREIPVDDPAIDATKVPAAVAGAPLVEVTDLSVAHPGGRAVISGLSFALGPAELLVITGDSGSGKSTLALALSRFLDYGGSYRLGGVEAREFSGAAVRGFVGLCEQQPHLFNTDLRQNLKFAKEDATDEELLAVLERVGLGEWVRERGGLDALVGERGALVSGGQMQRISLARVILADFPVVILDEPTAGVDQLVADRLLRDLLGAIPEDRAVILITHTAVPEGVPISARIAL
ncbi:thiol reductant ABC exporter subunit CydC [Leucobacter aridicollis]|uniref:ATP-binding cassette subfamily C protein CydC n=1 Tax=Leucobacter aridicollis TaxID=283878 RepID=A0A852RFB9_9MICO|nr:thiol reductant ABC exporter subunit CydC [Leucobacter aridicollis]MBL3681980.1 thiol reductant ABC exporter subunit CydC [Leucobacter aridicollis]NYD26974.1 ATP-binding cassette subfamily C protein CydC [Leucobacter aridicollis]